MKEIKLDYSDKPKIFTFKAPLGGEIAGCSEIEYIYYDYQRSRDVVFILGAGASYSNGAPLQANIIPYLYNSDDYEMKGSNAYRTSTEFINSYFSPDIEHNIYPSLEQLFGYIEYHLSHGESLNKNYDMNQLKMVKSSLYYLIHYIINKNKNVGPDGAYSRFWSNISMINRNISIITFNYDTLMEESFDNIYFKHSLIDYLIDFINYDSLNRDLGFDWWIDPRKPISLPIGKKAEDYDIVPIKIIKPHGSLNWKYCNCCNRVMLTPWQSEVDLDKLEFGVSFLDNNTKLRCPYDSSPFTQLIIPPTHYKIFTNRILLNLFSEAIQEIRFAKKICFIGYSFPEADIHIKAILNKTDLSSKEVYCVNPYLSDASKFNFKSLKRDIQFIETGFKEFIESDLFQTVIAP